jgi:hypothetical protein
MKMKEKGELDENERERRMSLLLKFLTLPLIVLGCLRVVPTSLDFIWRK